ncbi:MAG: hypothetical protein ACFE9L_19115 [Candidatus Hodarchaeota archaeon]
MWKNISIQKIERGEIGRILQNKFGNNTRKMIWQRLAFPNKTSSLFFQGLIGSDRH